MGFENPEEILGRYRFKGIIYDYHRSTLIIRFPVSSHGLIEKAVAAEIAKKHELIFEIYSDPRKEVSVKNYPVFYNVCQSDDEIEPLIKKILEAKESLNSTLVKIGKRLAKEFV